MNLLSEDQIVINTRNFCNKENYPTDRRKLLFAEHKKLVVQTSRRKYNAYSLSNFLNPSLIAYNSVKLQPSDI